MQLLRPTPPGDAAPTQDAPQSAETTSRLAAADRVSQTAARGAPDASEAVLSQLLREVSSLRAETAQLRREAGRGTRATSTGAAEVHIDTMDSADLEDAEHGRAQDVQRVMVEALSASPAGRPAAAPVTDADDDASIVTPALHRAFFRWMGASRTLRNDVDVVRWCEAASKRWALREWRDRAKKLGINVQDLPGSLRPLVRALLRAYLAEPGSVRGASPRA